MVLVNSLNNFLARIGAKKAPQAPNPDYFPYLELQGPQVGPHIFITAGIHGDEVAGIMTIHELLTFLEKTPLLSGKLSIIPCCNPQALAAGTRHHPTSKQDLNRLFPGSKKATHALLLAHAIYRKVEKARPDLLIDIHNDWYNSAPYAIINEEPDYKSPVTYRKSLHMAQLLNLPVVTEDLTQPIHAGLEKSLAGHASLQGGIPAITLEAGGSPIVSEYDVELAMQILTGLLHKLGMIGPQPTFSNTIPKAYLNQTLEYTSCPPPQAAGIIRYRALAGQVVEAGQTLAEIFTPSGELLQTIVSPQKALVLGHADDPYVTPKTDIYALALPPQSKSSKS